MDSFKYFGIFFAGTIPTTLDLTGNGGQRAGAVDLAIADGSR
jgi:hypothetical protein